MAFPISPVDGTQATVNNILYQYNATVNRWQRVLTTAAVEFANRNSFNFVTWNTGTALIIADTAETASSFIYVPSSSDTLSSLSMVNTNTGGAVLLEQGGGVSSNTLQVDSRGVSIVNIVNDLQTGNWLFGADGRTTLPIAGAPTTSKGAAGDKAGMIAVNSASIFYCIANYDTGATDIWVKQAWGTTGTW